jgi:hypothetical protein
VNPANKCAIEVEGDADHDSDELDSVEDNDSIEPETQGEAKRHNNLPTPTKDSAKSVSLSDPSEMSVKIRSVQHRFLIGVPNQGGKDYKG